MKRGWYKSKQTGEVVFVEGLGQHQTTVVMRDRSRALSWVTGDFFAREYEPIKASGFPSLKPKEFKPKFDPSRTYYSIAGYYVPNTKNSFDVYGKDGVWRGTMALGVVKLLFETGMVGLAKHKRELHPYQRVIVDAICGTGDKPSTLSQVSAILDVPKAAFKYLDGETYRRVTDGKWFHPEGYVRWYDGIPVDSFRKLVEEGRFLPANQFKPLQVPVTVKKKFLVEWAVASGSLGCHYAELWPEGVSPAAGQKHFKTGRTVEVPE